MYNSIRVLYGPMKVVYGHSSSHIWGGAVWSSDVTGSCITGNDVTGSCITGNDVTGNDVNGSYITGNEREIISRVFPGTPLDSR